MAQTKSAHYSISSTTNLIPTHLKPSMAMCSRTLTSTFPNFNGTSFATTPRKQPRATMEAYEEGKLERPKWSGETPLSRLVGALISFKPLYSVMKFGARQALISTAEKTNIPWREMTREVLDSEVYKEMENVQNPDIVYPDYYLNPFHAYDEGNLSWLLHTSDPTYPAVGGSLLRHWDNFATGFGQPPWFTTLAAAEAEPATLSITKRAIPEAASVEEAMEIVRGNWIRAIEKHHEQYSGNSTIQDIIDIGCSVGFSTKFLANKFPSANVTGLDLSPYFLAVAKYKEKNGVAREKSINWVHANGEDTKLPSKSFDLVSIAYVLHECPARATINLVKEAFRLLRPGGTIAITDNSPKSKKLQELSPVLFTLMKSTEPFLDEYYLLDLEGAMKETGFIQVQTVLTDPRHRTVTATVPF